LHRSLERRESIPYGSPFYFASIRVRRKFTET